MSNQGQIKRKKFSHLSNEEAGKRRKIANKQECDRVLKISEALDELQILLPKTHGVNKKSKLEILKTVKDYIVQIPKCAKHRNNAGVQSAKLKQQQHMVKLTAIHTEMDIDFDQTQAVVLEEVEEDDLTDDLESDEEKKPTAYIKVLFQKGLTETTYPLYEGDNIIGRHADTCHVCIPSKSLSKEHACVQVTAGSHLIADKNSLNKTRRGKLLLRPDVWYELKHGDEIMFADVKCIYEISQQITETVEETESEADTSESLLLHHDVTEEHSFGTADNQADKKEYQKCHPAGKDNSSEALETQVFVESEDEAEVLKNNIEIVQETMLFEDSDSDTDSDHEMDVAATQAYSTEGGDNNTDDSVNSNDHDMYAAATQAYSTKSLDGSSNDCADHAADAATQAYVETPTNLKEDDMRHKSIQIVVKPGISHEEKMKTVNSVHKPSSPQAGTQSFEVEAKSSLEGTQSFEETENRNNIQNDSRDSNMRPTQVFDEDDIENNEDAVGLFAVSTMAYDGCDNNSNDAHESVHSDLDGPTQVLDLEAPKQKTVTKHFDKTAEINKFNVTTPFSEELVKNIATEMCCTTKTAPSSAEIPTQIIDEVLAKAADQVTMHATDEALTQTVDEALTQTVVEVPVQKAAKNLPVKTLANTSRNLRYCKYSKEIMSTHVFDEPISIDVKKINQRKTDHQKKSPQTDNNTSDGILISTESTLLVSEISDKECHSRKGRRKLSQKTISEQPTKAVNVSDEYSQNSVLHCESSDLVTTEEKHQKLNSHNKHHQKLDSSDEGNKLSRSPCKTKNCSEEPTQAYGIEEDIIATQTYDLDCLHEAVSVLEGPTQVYGSEDVDNLQKCMDNEKAENGVCIESDDNEVATQNFFDKDTSQKFDVVEDSLMKTSDIITERLSDRSADPSKAQMHYDDDSDMEDMPVLKSNLQPFYDPAQLFDDDIISKAANKEPTNDVTVKGKSGGGEEAHTVPDVEEMVPDSMADDTDERPPMIPLPTRSLLEPAMYADKKLPSKQNKREQIETDKEVEKKQVVAKRTKREQTVPLLQESNSDDSSSSKRRKDRKKVISEATCSEVTKSLVVEKLTEDKINSASELKPEQKLSDTVKKEDSSLAKNESDLDKLEREQKPSLDTQKSSSRASRKRTATSTAEDSDIATPDRQMAVKTVVQKTRAKRGKILISNEQAGVNSKPVNTSDEISEPVSRKTRRSVALKRQDLDVRDTTEERPRIVNEIFDHQELISSENNNMAPVQSVVKKETESIESDETASIALSLNDSNVNIDVEKKEEIIKEKRKGRKQKIRKIKMEDSSESNIDDSSSLRVSSRGRRISINPYLKDFETHSKKDQQRRSSTLPQGDETNTENKMNIKDTVSDVKHVGKGKRKKANNVTSAASEELYNSMESSQQVETKSKQVIAIDSSRDDSKHSASKKALQFKSPGQDILSNKSEQEGASTKKIVKSTRKVRKSTLSKETESLSRSDSLQADSSDKGQISEPSSKLRMSVNNTVSSGLASNAKHPIEERLITDECKSSRRSRYSAVQTSSAQSNQQIKTQNVMPPEFQTPNILSLEKLPPDVKSNTRVRKSLPATSVNTEVRESEKTQLSKVKGNMVATASQAMRESRIKKKSETLSEVSITPAKKSKLTSSPLTPVGKADICKENSHSPVLRKSSMNQKPRIMFTGLIDEHGEKIVKDLGGEMANSIQECTHLVTDKIRRTVKFLSGLAKGLLIVSPRWLESCKQAGTFIDGRLFLVSDPTMEKQYKFNLATSINKAQGNPLLTGYKVHVSKSVRPEPAQMHDVLTCAGAEYLRSMPSKLQDNIVIISCPEDHKLCQSAIKLGIPVVEAEFILTGILRQELDFESFVLFTDKHVAQQTRKSKSTR